MIKKMLWGCVLTAGAMVAGVYSSCINTSFFV